MEHKYLLLFEKQSRRWFMYYVVFFLSVQQCFKALLTIWDLVLGLWFLAALYCFVSSMWGKFTFQCYESHYNVNAQITLSRCSCRTVALRILLLLTDRRATVPPIVNRIFIAQKKLRTILTFYFVRWKSQMTKNTRHVYVFYVLCTMIKIETVKVALLVFVIWEDFISFAFKII